MLPPRLTLLGVVALALAQSLGAATALIDLDESHQTIEGFGASITYGGSYGIYLDDAFLDFLAHDLGFSMYRMEIQGRVSTPMASADVVRRDRFDLDSQGVGKSVDLSVRFARGLQLRRPEVRAIGTVWSPPAWMKDNNSTTGNRSGFILSGADPTNRLSTNKYEHFARFLMEYVELFRERGVRYYALSPANELMFTQTFQSCLWHPQEYARIIRTLGETFASADLQRPLIYGPEDMTMATYAGSRHKPYVDALMTDEIAQFFDIFATHGYTDGVQSGGTMDPAAYWNAIRQFNRRYWITEGGTGGHAWPTPITSGIAGYLHHALTGGNVSAFTAWQIDGISADEHSVMVNGHPTKKTYAAMHYWRFIRPGFVRVNASTAGNDSSGIRLSAFRDPNGERLAIVAINTNSSARQLDLVLSGQHQARSLEVYQTTATDNFKQTATLDLDGNPVALSLPPSSITTLASRVPVSGITMDAAELDLNIGETGYISYHVAPQNASNQRVQLISSNETVATVDGSGRVTALEEGDATLTAITAEGNYAGTTLVRVRFSNWAGWTVDESGAVDTGQLFIGRIHARKNTGWIFSQQRNGWIHLPESHVRNGSAWAFLPRLDDDDNDRSTGSANRSAAATPTAATPTAATPTAATNVLLNKPVTVSNFSPGSEGWKLVDNSYGFTTSERWVASGFPQWAKIDMGAPHRLSEFRLYPWENRGYLYTIAVSDDDLVYTTVVDRSAANSAASVFINAVDTTARYVLLTVLAGGSYTGPWVNLHELQGFGSIVQIPVSGLRLAPAHLVRGPGQRFPLRAEILPQYATDRALRWQSSAPEIVAVDPDGVITALAIGTATITATSNDGAFTASSRIEVADTNYWGTWPLLPSGHADTADFAGIIYVHGDSGWIFVYDLAKWAWLPESALRESGAWALLIY